MEISSDGEKVRCGLCQEHCAADNKGDWIAKTSFAKHRKRAVHLKAETRQIEAAAAAAAATLPPSEGDFAILNDVQMNEAVAPQSSATNAEEQAMWERYDTNQESIQFEVGEDLAKLVQEEHQKLEHKADEYGYGHWGGAEVLPDDTDLGVFWDEDEEEDLLAEVMRNMALGELPPRESLSVT